MLLLVNAKIVVLVWGAFSELLGVSDAGVRPSSLTLKLQCSTMPALWCSSSALQPMPDEFVLSLDAKIAVQRYWWIV
jgi:hypothetical protein